MPKKNSKRKAYHERKKYCHCSPFCNKKLTQQARRLHYNRLRPEQLEAVHDSATATVSDYSSYFSSDSDMLEPPLATSSFNSTKGSLSEENTHQIFYEGSGEDEVEGNDSERGYMPELEEEDGEVGRDVQDDNEHFEWNHAGGSARDEDSEEEPEGEGFCGDDFRSNQGSNSEFDEWKDYHEDDERAALQSDEERLHEFEDILGPEEHAELWETRLYFIFCNLTR